MVTRPVDRSSLFGVSLNDETHLRYCPAARGTDPHIALLSTFRFVEELSQRLLTLVELVSRLCVSQLATRDSAIINKQTNINQYRWYRLIACQIPESSVDKCLSIFFSHIFIVFIISYSIRRASSSITIAANSCLRARSARAIGVMYRTNRATIAQRRGANYPTRYESSSRCRRRGSRWRIATHAIEGVLLNARWPSQWRSRYEL